jgi:hypothetical protein
LFSERKINGSYPDRRAVPSAMIISLRAQF